MGAWMTSQEESLKTLLDRNNTVGTGRQELLGTIADGDPYGLAEHFGEMTPMQKALGLLYGKLMAARGFNQVDNAFAWFETEYDELMEGKAFSDFQKNMILVNTIQQLVGANPDGIRVLRKVLVTLNTK